MGPAAPPVSTRGRPLPVGPMSGCFATTCARVVAEDTEANGQNLGRPGVARNGRMPVTADLVAVLPYAAVHHIIELECAHYTGTYGHVYRLMPR